MSFFILSFIFFFNDTPTPQIYTLSLHDALPISGATATSAQAALATIDAAISSVSTARSKFGAAMNRLEVATRSEEHTSELQSQSNLVCRLLLEKKKNYIHSNQISITILVIKSPY